MRHLITRLFPSKRNDATEHPADQSEPDVAIGENEMSSRASAAVNKRTRSVELEPGYSVHFSDEEVAAAEKRMADFRTRFEESEKTAKHRDGR
jgi:hypothetical protein